MNATCQKKIKLMREDSGSPFFFVKFAKNLSCYDEKLQVRASSISINRQRRRRRAMGCTEPDKDIIEQILAGRQDL